MPRVGNKAISTAEVFEQLPVVIAAAPSAQPLAVLEFTDGCGKIPVLSASSTIGRHNQDDIRINNISVSRHHAQLVRGADGRFELHNLTVDRSEPILVNGVEKNMRSSPAETG
jgi:hypothetical protein